MYCNFHLHYLHSCSICNTYTGTPRINVHYMWVDICQFSHSLGQSVNKMRVTTTMLCFPQFQCANTIAWLPNAILYETGGCSFEQPLTLYSQQWYLSICGAGLTGWSSISCNISISYTVYKLHNTKYMNPVFKLLLIKFFKDHNSHTVHVTVRRNCIFTIPPSWGYVKAPTNEVCCLEVLGDASTGYIYHC